MDRQWTSRLTAAFLALSLACSGSITAPGSEASGGGAGSAGDEQFPSSLLTPYSGPAIDVYDNTFLGYMQLKGKVAALFGDAWVRGGTDQFQANIGLLGGADFVSHFVEARVATPDFLLAIDSLTKDVCSAAVAAVSGPFAGLDVAAPVVDVPPSQTVVLQAENPNDMVAQGNGGVNGAEYGLYSNGTLSSKAAVHFPTTDQYDIVVKARSYPGRRAPARTSASAGPRSTPSSPRPRPRR